MKRKLSVLLVAVALVLAALFGADYLNVLDLPINAETTASSEQQETFVDYSEADLISTDETAAFETTESERTTKKPKATTKARTTKKNSDTVEKGGQYYSKQEVALYIHKYGHLPDNYITKSEAKALGWSGGSVEQYAQGKAIGGDKFGNRENSLPASPGRQYYECDIDTFGASSRGEKRIVFSNDGYIYYTDDHYESFEMLYSGG